jgi:hypothetical protein
MQRLTQGHLVQGSVHKRPWDVDALRFPRAINKLGRDTAHDWRSKLASWDRATLATYHP